jgi:hypothetical protein
MPCGSVSHDSAHHGLQSRSPRADPHGVRILVTSDGARERRGRHWLPQEFLEPRGLLHPPSLEHLDPRRGKPSPTVPAVADFAWNWVPGGDVAAVADTGADRQRPRRRAGARGEPAIVAEGGALDVSTSVILTYRQTALQRNPGVPLERSRLIPPRLWQGACSTAARPWAIVTDRPKIENYVGWGRTAHRRVCAIRERFHDCRRPDRPRADDNSIRADHDIPREPPPRSAGP